MCNGRRLPVSYLFLNETQQKRSIFLIKSNSFCHGGVTAQSRMPACRFMLYRMHRQERQSDDPDVSLEVFSNVLSWLKQILTVIGMLF